MNKSKYPTKYIGKNDLDNFFDFLDEYSSMENVPMPNDKISVISKNNVLPEQYVMFLQRAGLQFGQWDGSDYVLVSECNEFVDLRKDIVNDVELISNFLFYGIDIKDCFFLFRSTGECICVLFIGW